MNDQCQPDPMRDATERALDTLNSWLKDDPEAVEVLMKCRAGCSNDLLLADPFIPAGGTISALGWTTGLVLAMTGHHILLEVENGTDEGGISPDPDDWKAIWFRLATDEEEEKLCLTTKRVPGEPPTAKAKLAIEGHRWAVEGEAPSLEEGGKACVSVSRGPTGEAMRAFDNEVAKLTAKVTERRLTDAISEVLGEKAQCDPPS